MTSSIINFIHLLAAVVWIGGMIYSYFVLTPALAAIDPPQRGRLVGAAAKRFSILAWTSVIVLIITGLLITPSGMLFSTVAGFGLTLLLKHIVVLAMIVVGLIISLRIAPRLQTLAPQPGSPPDPGFLQAQKQLGGLSLLNMLLGILVLVLVAFL